MYRSGKAAKRTSRRGTSKKMWLGAAAVLVLAVAVVGTLEATNVTHLFHEATPRPPAPTAGQNTKGEVKLPAGSPASPGSGSSSDASSQPPTSSAPGGQKGNGGGSAALLAPDGEFVSHHKPAKGATITSVCTTTSGAMCKIVFSKDGVSKSLPLSVTDRDGSAYWDWKTSDSFLKLTPGNWHIQAVATLNGQTKTTDDALNLVVPE